ncbi:C39 family peptidase [Lentzea tibetensis]|uniref:C39 family peptidase n=1 Tax=Lentzea tibetensis TaxID=2591470 RepID=UPI001C9A1F7B|nr:C39 family peptidase [Lentzea tibetensis]
MLDVVRYPQRFAPDEWPAGAVLAGEGAQHWSDRACGLACLRMVFDHFGLPVPSQWELLVEALELDAYTPRGWKHQGLADLAVRRGLVAVPLAIGGVDELHALLRGGGPVIVSVTHELPVDGRRGGHLVVVAGVRIPEHEVVFRDPSRWGGENSVVPAERFVQSFSGRGIAFSRAT